MSTRYIHSGAQVIATLDLPAVPSQAAVTGAESDRHPTIMSTHELARPPIPDGR